MRKQRGRPVHGILLLDKPPGLTSNRVLQKVKRLYQAAKAGHTGSLDPFATGMLPICLGSATKTAAYLLDSSKEYSVTLEFGRATTTGDIDGDVIEEAVVEPKLPAEIEGALGSFVGASTQVPPMYSALKYEGKRLYELARRGVAVERAPRAIRIDWIRLEQVDWPSIRFSVRCSKGTYIRSLATDIAARLDTIGFVSALRRICVDPFGGRQMVTLEDLETAVASGDRAADSLLLPPESGLVRFGAVYVDSTDREALVQGRSVPVAAETEEIVRIYDAGNAFIGLGTIGEDRRLRPKRIFIS